MVLSETVSSVVKTTVCCRGVFRRFRHYETSSCQLVGGPDNQNGAGCSDKTFFTVTLGFVRDKKWPFVADEFLSGNWSGGNWPFFGIVKLPLASQVMAWVTKMAQGYQTKHFEVIHGFVHTSLVCNENDCLLPRSF